MRVDTLRVRNFRCFGEPVGGGWALILRLARSLNLLVGPNGSGKTAILDALDIVLNPEGRSNQALVSEYDFHSCDPLVHLCAEVVLTEVDPVLPEFDSDIQWLDPADGSLVEEKGVEVDSSAHERCVVIGFEAALDEATGAIDWEWYLPKYPATGAEPRKRLTRAQHMALGYYRIRPAVSAGAFTLGRYSALGRQLSKLNYRLGKLPSAVRGHYARPTCEFLLSSCGDCPERAACLPIPSAGEEEGVAQQPLGAFLAGVLTRAQSIIGAGSWSDMTPTLGPRYGGLSSSLAGITLGVRPRDETERFIPFEYLSDGERYALSFALARSQIPGEITPVIVMEEPETALYPSGVAALVRDIQAAPSTEAPQVLLSSHSEAVLRCARAEDVFVVDREHGVENLGRVLKAAATTSKDQLHRPEYLLRPGGPSVLLADKVVVVEGPGDAIVGGYLDRLAAANASRLGVDHKSFAAKGWSIYSADNADAIPAVVPILRLLGKAVAAVFDADERGKAGAERTKTICPTFLYRSAEWNQPCIEEALLAGLDNGRKPTVLSALQSSLDCSTCGLQAAQKARCWSVGYECAIGSKDGRKSRLQMLCLEEYEKAGGFPKAFATLLEYLDTAAPGAVTELVIDL